LSLDLDNTLLDRDAAAEAWWRARIADPELLAEALRRDGHGQTDRGALFAWAARQCLGDARALWEAFRLGIADHVRPDPAVQTLLRDLRPRYRLGVLTDGSVDGQRRKLAAAGLDDLVDVVVISAELGVRKPHRRCFDAIVAALGVPRNEVLHVGDHVERDTIGALRAGLSAVHVGLGPSGVPAIPHVTALPEVLPC
jgi:putative hydrolase of the HAD superfamily